MATSQADITQHRHVTPPSRSTNQPLTPPLTDKKPFTEAPRVIAQFRQIQAGRDTGREPWKEFELAQGEYDQIEMTLQQDDVLSGYVEDKIRYDYDGDKCTLVVCMPTEIHERFIDAVEDDIRSQLKAIRSGSDRKARFAQKVQPARSTEIRFAASASSSKSKYEPDASFGHDDAQYPGVILEVAYSQKKTRLRRLAENYLLDSDASVRVVVGLDIEYGKDSRKATLSIWRPQLFRTASGYELRAVEEAVDEAFRDDEGHPVEHPGLRLRLSDFTCKELAEEELGDEDAEICISGIQLCRYVDAAESKVRRALRKESLADNVNKRKRSETPPEEIQSSDDARYAKQEERAAKRTADHDIDYEYIINQEPLRVTLDHLFPSSKCLYDSRVAL
ncbi:uncharacterized protein BDZ99DRAFT_397834 [Mytilinidion resinicola]|uniref:Uncharacterized protein n=1 Tax=Mytilinidion resinicola TaxID=574789 RepID=A0A6A6Y777_9PEZI|nr:uncharacterized protein BDZ99DRAFT_397834 [Mytilinidion resinicola]KAF2804388.1 hypothetical protein BDZ99DRAFT_397834 [Mytilinidion resinicola]